MKLSHLIKVLRKAKTDYGDVDVQLMDEEAGRWMPIAEVIKRHPYRPDVPAMDRTKPVQSVGITRHKGNASDLIIS